MFYFSSLFSFMFLFFFWGGAGVIFWLLATFIITLNSHHRYSTWLDFLLIQNFSRFLVWFYFNTRFCSKTFKPRVRTAWKKYEHRDYNHSFIFFASWLCRGCDTYQKFDKSTNSLLSQYKKYPKLPVLILSWEPTANFLSKATNMTSYSWFELPSFHVATHLSFNWSIHWLLLEKGNGSKEKISFSRAEHPT